jgi:hypothetical protein
MIPVVSLSLVRVSFVPTFLISRFDASIVSRLPVRIARRQLQDSPTTLEEGAKHSAFIAELFLKVNEKEKKRDC